MECKQCGSKYVTNKWFKLCSGCNNIRLHGNKYGKQVDYKEKNLKSLKTAKNDSIKRVVDKGSNKNKISHKVKEGTKKVSTFKLDEELYERVFNKCKVHECEECGNKLNEEFRNEDGKINLRSRYSHIIPKSIAPEIRHDDDNINNLCISCHQHWDFGDRTKMLIYDKNQLKWPKYLKPRS